MKPFTAPLSDILFSFEHLADASRLQEWDGVLYREIAQHFATFAEQEIAPIDEHGDQQGCTLRNGRVTMPDGFKDVYAAYIDQGWPSLTAPEFFGGQGMSPVVLAMTSEIFSGACHSLQMVTGLVPGAIRTLVRFGTDKQKARFIPQLASGQTLATMCLTEPNAGSDLSQVGCRAAQHDSSWHITGEKIFISGGDQNISDNILHLVLARTSDDGVRGLSLFLCTDKIDSGRNAITVTRIEEKVGLHASPTCQLSFDNAEGELIGEVGQGLRAMFTMMNHARLDVALQGVAHAARAHDVGNDYASERLQGRGADGAQIALIEHADVNRMLHHMDALAVGARAIAHLAIVTLEAGENTNLVEFLTPIAKVYCSEAGMLGTQVLGGYGYLSEYRLEQTYRDARITAIYEGANGIHERALSERLLRGSNAAAADAFDGYVASGADNSTTNLQETLANWREAREIVAKAANADVLAPEFMTLTTDTLLHSIWDRAISVASHHNDPKRIALMARTQIVRIRAYIPAHLSMIKSKSEAG